MNSMKKKIGLIILLYPFFQPLGLNRLGFKTFFNVWRYMILIGIVCLIVFDLYNKKIKMPKLSYCIFEYQIAMFFITIVVQKGITEGFQKIFGILGLLLALTYYKQETKLILEMCLKIINFNLIMSLLMLNKTIKGVNFNVESHKVLQGHVQVLTMIFICTMGIITLRFYENNKLDILDWISLSLSILAGLITGRIVFSIVLVLGLVLSLCIKYLNKPIFSCKTYTVIWITLNIIMWKLSTNEFLCTRKINLHGRVFIWKKAIDLWKERCMFGYGVYGIKITMFWNAIGEGMNYIHNELLQKLIDGGIILELFFVHIIWILAKMIDKKITCKYHRRETKYMKVIFILWLVLMITESVTEYSYFWINIILFSNICYSKNMKNQRKSLLG